jgi:hypothetical protein
MKKFALPMGVLAILIAGLLFFTNQQEEVIPTVGNEIVVSDTQTEDAKVSKVSKETEKTNEKSAKVDSGEVSEAKEVNNEKVIINTLTGDNVPAGFYDEVLEDDYTYNNPKPLEEAEIFFPATLDFPKTIKFNPLSTSYLVPNYPGQKYLGNYKNTEYMYGTNYRILDIEFNNPASKASNKSDFTKWANQYGIEFIFIQQYKSSDLNRGKTSWKILVTNFNINTLKETIGNINNEGIVEIDYLSNIPLKQYRDNGLYNEYYRFWSKQIED